MVKIANKALTLRALEITNRALALEVLRFAEWVLAPTGLANTILAFKILRFENTGLYNWSILVSIDLEKSWCNFRHTSEKVAGVQANHSPKPKAARKRNHEGRQKLGRQGGSPSQEQPRGEIMIMKGDKLGRQGGCGRQGPKAVQKGNHEGREAWGEKTAAAANCPEGKSWSKNFHDFQLSRTNSPTLTLTVCLWSI